MSLIRETLSRVEIGEPIQHQTLIVYPLLSTTLAISDYLTLDEALATQKCQVSEVSEGGVVAELFFENLDKQPILLLDGEELVGAKQNRVLNLTILCAGELKITIPVSCVEQGRWRYRSKHFESAGRTLYGRARAAKMRSVSASMVREGSRRSDQGEVWDQIAFKMDRMAARSDTGAAEAIYERSKPQTDAFVAAILPVSGQVGAVFVVNGSVIGLELFDSPATYRKVSGKLVESFALDALDVDVPGTQDLKGSSVPEFLDQLRAADERRFKAVGLGNDFRIESDAVLAAGLEVDGRVIHLSAFAAGRPHVRSTRTVC